MAKSPKTHHIFPVPRWVSTIVGVIITGAAVCGGGVHSCIFKDWEFILTNQNSTATNQFVLFMSRFLK